RREKHRVSSGIFQPLQSHTVRRSGHYIRHSEFWSHQFNDCFSTSDSVGSEADLLMRAGEELKILRRKRMSRKNSFTEQNFVQWKRCAHALGAAGAIVLLLVAVAKTQEPQKPKVPVPPATPAASSAAAPASTHELTAADLEAFL